MATLSAAPPLSLPFPLDGVNAMMALTGTSDRPPCLPAILLSSPRLHAVDTHGERCRRVLAFRNQNQTTLLASWLGMSIDEFLIALFVEVPFAVSGYTVVI
jgi:hypothetical protein